MNSTFRVCWLASSEVISQVLFTSEQPKKNKMAFVGILWQIKLLFRPLVIQLVWYILKTNIHLSVGESGGYLPPLRWIIVNKNNNNNNDNNNNSCSRRSSSTTLQIEKEKKNNYAWLRLHFGWTKTKHKFVREHMLNFIFDSSQHICLFQRKKFGQT